MKKYLLRYVIIFGILIFSSIQTQSASAQEVKSDSTSASKAAADVVDMLNQEHLLRYEDSVAKAALRLQIENTAEIKARTALEKLLHEKNAEDSLRLEKLKAQIESNRKNAIGYPVVIAGDTVRIVYTAFGTLLPEDRARISTEKIKDISRLYMPSIDSLTIVKEGLGVEIVFNDNILATVTQSDAIWENRDQMVIAKEIVDAAHNAIIKHKKMTSFLTVAKQVGLSLLIIVSGILLIRIINRAFRNKIKRYLVGKEGNWFKGWKLREYEFMNSRKQVKFTLIIIKIIRLILGVLIFIITAVLLFSIFPFTERLAGIIFGWIVNPVKNIFWAIFYYLPKLIVVIIICIVIRYVIKAVKYFMNEIATGKIKIKGFYPDWADSTYNIIRILLYAFGLVMIFPYLPGSDSDVFKGVSIFLGVLVSLGSSSMIGNLIAGLVITYMRPFKIGDHIKIGETTGDVLEKTPFVTRIKTYRQEIVTIPNSNILSAAVINYSTEAQDSKGVIFHTTISMQYDVPWRDVHKYLIEAALRSEYILKNPAPFVLQTSLDDFYVSYQICAYSRNPEKQATIYSQLHSNIQDVFNEHGLELLSPHYRALIDTDKATAPK